MHKKFIKYYKFMCPMSDQNAERQKNFTLLTP